MEQEGRARFLVLLWEESSAAEFVMVKNVLLTIEYDGTGFSGWQRQPEARTVQGTVEKVLMEIVGEPVRIDGVSRTDAGVHARDQKAVFRADLKVPVEKLAHVMNDRLQGRPEARSENDDIRIVSAEEVPVGRGSRRSEMPAGSDASISDTPDGSDARVSEVPDGFDIRGCVIGKTYRYSIRNAAEMPVFDRNYRYHIKQNLDLAKMREAAEYIKGTHDFACFQAAGAEPGRSTVRTIWSVSVNKVGDDIFIYISGDGFLYNMVRIITGTLVEVGLGKREPEDIARIIESRDRCEAGHTAPPQGLYLMRVYMDRVCFWGQSPKTHSGG